MEIVDNPRQNYKQHVVFRYFMNRGKLDVPYKVTDAYCEEGEVKDVRWISIGEIDKYKWINHRNKYIKQVFQEKVIGKTYWQKIKNYIKLHLN